MDWTEFGVRLAAAAGVAGLAAEALAIAAGGTAGGVHGATAGSGEASSSKPPLSP